MVRQFASILMCLAMFAVIGGHWAAMQTVAWAEMIWSYSVEEGSLEAGCEKTFSGEAPCEMCRAIAQGRSKEQKQSAILKAEKKVGDFLLAKREFSLWPACVVFAYPKPISRRFPRRNVPPPSPVPIEAANLAQS